MVARVTTVGVADRIASMPVKFLFWQFSLYAAAAMAAGIGIGVWVTRTGRAHARNELARARNEAGALRDRMAELSAASTEADQLRASNFDLTQLVDRAQEAAAVAEMHRAALESATRRAEDAVLTTDDRLAAQRPFVRRTIAAEREVARLAGERDAAVASRDAERSASVRALADATARADALKRAYDRLQAAHAATIRESQTQLTQAVVRAEKAEAAASNIAAAAARAARPTPTTTPPVVVPEVRGPAADESPSPGADPPRLVRVPADIDSPPDVIDLRFDE